MKSLEELAKDLYLKYLRSLGFNASAERGPDPPDFIFRCNSKRWAVEVTEMHQYISWQGAELSRMTMDSALLKFGQEIEGQVESVERAYVLILSGPYTPKELCEIKNAVLEYIRSGQDNTQYLLDRTDTWIEKVDDRPQGLYTIVGLQASTRVPGQEAIAADIQANVNYAISRILREKVPRLAAIKGYDKVVLLILKSYMFASKGNVSRAVSQILDQNSVIDEVVLVSSDSVDTVF